MKNRSMTVHAAVGAVIVIALLLIGYTAPVERIFVPDARAAQPTVEGNGPTGYFPDLFTIIEQAAEPAEHIEAF